MSHAVHTTNAIVLSSTDVQDADKLFWLLTEDFGLIFASAKSIREETSKLRYVLQDLSNVQVSVVKGRGIWRVTGAQSTGVSKLKGEKIKIFGRVAAITKRLMPTDEVNKEIFSTLLNSREKIDKAENLTVARVLFHLGYLTCTDEYSGIIDTLEFSEEEISSAEKMKDKLVADINNGLVESQL